MAVGESFSYRYTWYQQIIGTDFIMTGIVFHQLNPAKTKSFVKRVNKMNPDYRFQEKTVKILAHNLPFAPGWSRYDCEDYSTMPHQKHVFIANDDDIKAVSYTSDPVANVFGQVDLAIDETTIGDYLHFYLMALNTGGENLRPLLSVDDVAWREDLSPMARKSLDKELLSYPVIKKTISGFEVSMAVVFRQSLMVVTCSVTKDGKVNFIDRAVIIEDLPIINDLTDI